MLEAAQWTQVLLLAGLFACAAQVTVRTKNVVKGGLCLYGLLWLWVLLFGVAVPGLLRAIHHTPDVPRLLPENVGVLSVSLFGLVAAFAFAGVVRLAHTAADWSLQGRGRDRPVDRLMRFLQRIGFRAIGKRVDRFGGAERALYPKWVGVILGYLLPGSAHVLGGCRRAGVAWFLWFPIASFLATCLIAIPGLWSLGAGVAVGLVLLVLWLLMLKHSYRPTRRIGWLGWLVLLVVVVWLGAGEKSLARLAIHPFRMSMGSMQPTLWGIHVREVDDKSARPGLPGERVRIAPPWLLVNDERVVAPPIFATIAGKEQGYEGFLSAASAGAPVESPSQEITLSADEYFVLGDNARDACDSREFGPVPRPNIVGRVTRIYRPLDRLNALEGRW